MNNKIIIIGPDSVHVENFIKLIKGAFKEVVFIGEHSLNSSLVDREYVLRSRSIDPYKVMGRYNRIKRIIQKEKPDLVHIHQVNRVAYFASIFLQKTHVPVYVTAWGSDVLLVPKRNILAKRMVVNVLKNATYISADSKNMIEAINELVPDHPNVNLIYFGIDPIPYDTKEKIIYSNRLHEKLYNIDRIIKEFSVFHKSNSDWRLIIAGEGHLTKSLKFLVKSLKIEEFVSFKGWLGKEENEAIYKKASIYVSIPSSDGTAVSLLEAMSAGCIPIVGDIPVSYEWVKNGKNGVIIQSSECNIFDQALKIDINNAIAYNVELIANTATKSISSSKFCKAYESLSKKKKVCHITTVHQRFDVRIFYKECTSLKDDYEVHLIVADGKGDEVKNNIHIHDIGIRQNSRLNRVRIDSRKAYRAANKLKCDVYHFHDPELIIIASKLKKFGAKVIYDVHEDLPRQIYGKPYMIGLLKPITSKLIEYFENKVARKMDYIFTSTPFIRDRFLQINPNTVDVNNFPIIRENINPITDANLKENSLSYVGGIFENRGVFELIESLKISKIKLFLAGEFESEAFKKKCEDSEGWKFVEYFGFLDRKQVVELLNKSKVGIVSLYPLRNYLDSLPIKMFEYMLASIPVIASDFPYWKKIVDSVECGINVNPKDIKAIAEKTIYLMNNPQLANKMGENGRKAVLEKYNWCNEEDKVFKVYKELLD